MVGEHEERSGGKTAGSGRWVVFFASLCTALAAACLFLVLRRPDESAQLGRTLPNGKLLETVVERLVAEARGIFDSHPDPDVGRLLLPKLCDVDAGGVLVSSNRLGLRERDFDLPKPPGTLRVVLLGDSVVYGNQAAARDRMGVFLEGYLERRAGRDIERIECLHVAIATWNVVAECQFVRRQLDLLQPDLVLQVIVSNDLDDNPGVRGFGAPAGFAPRYRRRADARVSHGYPAAHGARAGKNFLLHGLDWESRHRYEELARGVGDLAQALGRRGARYLLVVHWAHLKHLVRPFLVETLAPEQLLFAPDELFDDRDLWGRPDDPHWNRAGHELFAKFLFGVVRERGLLPALELEPWPECERLAADMIERARVQMADPSDGLPPYWHDARTVARELSFGAATPEVMRQVYTGVDRKGRVAPYGSMIVRASDAGRLRVEGEALGAPELDGLGVRVFVDEQELGLLELRAGTPFQVRWPLPPALAGREFVSVRFEAEDWIYAGDPFLRKCVAFRLTRVAIDP